MVSTIGMGHVVSKSSSPWRAHIEARLNRRPGELKLRGLKPAAVLIPIIERAEPAVLLTLRTEHLPTHAGQVSFPGGRFQESDATLTDTALRELEEEIGIARSSVEIAGYLDFHETVNSGFIILPVVGIVITVRRHRADQGAGPVRVWPRDRAQQLARGVGVRGRVPPASVRTVSSPRAS